VVAVDGEEGIIKACDDYPDIILLDVMLPKMSGLDLCRNLRSRGVDVPIIMLTARGQEIDKVLGLEVGADDYVTKPFGLNELLARVRAHLRRATKQVAEIDVYKFGDIEVNLKRYRASKGDRQLELTPREFKILKCFILHREEVVTREQLLDEVWGIDSFPISRTVDNHIAKLRQKIEDVPTKPQYIITVHRVGYKFLG
jgi:two-component system alkaline phosphatase synthesis response regulator PhoP